MGHRLSKIVTRTGDKGETGLATGERIPKSAPRVQALGDVDELNCCVGLLLVQELPEAMRDSLSTTQHELFDLGGELSLPGHALIKESYLLRLESELAGLNETLPPLKEFVLPGGNAAAAAAHLARAVARRAERSLWALNAIEPLSPLAPQYLNRLSDYLFVCARVLARLHGGREVSWAKSRA
ncbi:MAG TPA: cob(I)yrinic acid a,c-diamide adenosyltransferase [Nevskia sp.]|nr:cob(I)yrinic acid a,c-diamide adenosyltransferase [Nevskia sp.]